MQDFERECVPSDKTLNWTHIALVYIGVAITIPAFLLVANVALSLGYTKALLAVILSSVILSVFGILTGIVGAATNLSSYMIITNVFGKLGAKVVNVLFAITLSGWFGVTLSFFAEASNQILTLGYQTWLILGTCLMILTAIYGFKGLRIFSIIAVPFLLCLLYWFSAIPLRTTSMADILAIKGNATLSIGSAVSMFVGGLMVGVAIFPDLTRYTKSIKDGIIAGATSFMTVIVFALPIMIPILYYKQANIVEIIQNFGYPLWALLLIILASWSSNDNNLYSGALSLATIFNRISKNVIVLALAGLGYLCSAINITSHFIAFLMLLSAIIPPVAAIYCVDYFCKIQKCTKAINWKAMIAWSTGILTALLTTPHTSFGFEITTLTTIPALDGYLVAGTCYAIINKLSRPKSNTNK